MPCSDNTLHAQFFLLPSCHPCVSRFLLRLIIISPCECFIRLCPSCLSKIAVQTLVHFIFFSNKYKTNRTLRSRNERTARDTVVFLHSKIHSNVKIFPYNEGFLSRTIDSFVNHPKLISSSSSHLHERSLHLSYTCITPFLCATTSSFFTFDIGPGP